VVKYSFFLLIPRSGQINLHQLDQFAPNVINIVLVAAGIWSWDLGPSQTYFVV